MSDERTDLEKVTPAAALEGAAREGAGLRPFYPQGTGYGYGYGYAADDHRARLRELWRTVRKRKWLIITIVLIATTIAMVEGYRTKNTYQASTLIEIGKDSTALGRPGNIFGDDYDPFYMVNIKTKMLMVKSHSLLGEIVTAHSLDQNPRFYQSGGKKSVWTAVRLIGAKFGVTGAPEENEGVPDSITSSESTTAADGSISPEAKLQIERCIAILNAGLTVEPVKETRALRISFTHSDRELASEVTNWVAEEFLARNFDAKTEKYTGAAKWLDESTRRMKARVEESEQQLAAYTREHGIFLNDKEGTLTTAKLSSLHDQVVRAESERILKQSLYEEVKLGNVTRIPEAYADLLFKSSPKLVELQKQLGDLQTQAAELSVKYGPANPKIVEVQQRIEAIRGQIAESSRSLEAKLKTEYDRAVRDENMLKEALAQAKQEANVQNQAAIQANILKQDVDTNKSVYQDFLNKTNQANAQRAEQQNNLRIIEPAQVPGSPVGPRRGLTIMITLVLSSAFGFGLAFFLDYLDSTIKTVDDVSRYAQLPALSVIPAVEGAPRRFTARRAKAAIGHVSSESALEVAKVTALPSLDGRSSVAEAYRVLRTSVLLSAAGHAPKSILVTSGQPGEGKTTTVVNTAVSLAQLGASVLIIDCDLRRPKTHKVLGAAHERGLSTYLSRDVPLETVIQSLPIANLSLIPCGPIPPNPAELIISEKMKEMLKDLSARYDHILIDSPPLINVTDPVILSTMVDGVILVVHGGKSTREIVRRARHELSAVGARIFGVVLNNVDLKRDGYDDYYYSRYYTGYDQDERKNGHQRA
jgi:capsular exopolysaccharide synthesis family protein